MFAKDMQVAELLDIYGNLLSETKRNIIDLYYNEDYSLSEIAQHSGISRQGVHDSIKKSELELIDCENKLHFAEKAAEITRIVDQALAVLSKEETSDNVTEAIRLLKQIDL